MLRRLLLAAVVALAPSIASAQFATIAPTPQAGDNSNRIATTAFVQGISGGQPALPAGNIWIGSAGSVATPQTPSGDWTISLAGVATMATVNSNTGPFGSATQCVTVTSNAKGLLTSVSAVTCAPAIGSITGLGAGVGTALAVAVGSAGAPVVNGGPLGTPSSGNGSNLTNLAYAALPSLVANQLLGALTATTPSGQSVPSCSTASSALQWTSGTGFGCNTSITAAAVPIGAVTGLGTGVATALAINTNTTNGFATYQFGTWTPTFTGSSTPGTGQTYFTQVGTYEVIGRQVTLRFTLTATSLGTAAGNLQLSNFPFTSGATASDFGTCFVGFYVASGLAASNFGVTGVIGNSATFATIYAGSSTTSNAVTIAQAGNAVELLGVCHYHT
ncbi:hypothetical protein [Bradyrhizobium lablabi]|uniref:Uncharacterized protein n=1 Tax=Bradyrhizobium lablabi TaxID=722472 RepID=A0A1H5JHF3_9BRAD|nr:hypothetical protein [Bradyrhizobium lablabi]SEE51880.1 hypothetical protein SAMN05444171_7826 [Bradyrhizobium lablabi]